MASENERDAEHGSLLLQRERAQEAHRKVRQELGLLSDRLADGIGGGGIALFIDPKGNLCARVATNGRKQGETVIMPSTDRLKELVQQRDGAQREIDRIRVRLASFR
jgi:hypothetical protein